MYVYIYIRPADTGALDAKVNLRHQYKSTCFTSTKVQILTPEERAAKTAIAAALKTLSPEEQEELLGAPLAADAYRLKKKMRACVSSYSLNI
jgi:hypothetical protein